MKRNKPKQSLKKQQKKTIDFTKHPLLVMSGEVWLNEIFPHVGLLTVRSLSFVDQTFRKFILESCGEEFWNRRFETFPDEVKIKLAHGELFYLNYFFKSYSIEEGRKLKKNETFQQLSFQVMRNYLMDQKKSRRVYVKESLLKNLKPLVGKVPSQKLRFLADSDNLTFGKLLLTHLSTGIFCSDSSSLIQYFYREQVQIASSNIKSKSIEIQSIDARLDSLEFKSEKIDYSPVDYQSVFDTSCFVVIFNRMDRQNFETVINDTLTYVQNHSFNDKPIILVGLNWCRYFLDQSFMKTHFLYQRVKKHSIDFVSNDEILSVCQQNSNIISYIDAKPTKERDISDLLTQIIKTSLLSQRINTLTEFETIALIEKF